MKARLALGLTDSDRAAQVIALAQEAAEIEVVATPQTSDDVITVLAERVPDAYLGFLQSKGVSYLFGGKTKLNLRAVLNKLGREFDAYVNRWANVLATGVFVAGAVKNGVASSHIIDGRVEQALLLGEVDQLLAAGERPLAPRRDDLDAGMLERALGGVLHGEHHLHERVPGDVAAGVQLLDQALERDVPVCVGGQVRVAHPAEQLTDYAWSLQPNLGRTRGRHVLKLGEKRIEFAFGCRVVETFEKVSDFARSGSLLPPNSTSTMTRMTISSIIPMLPNM